MPFQPVSASLTNSPCTSPVPKAIATSRKRATFIQQVQFLSRLIALGGVGSKFRSVIFNVHLQRQYRGF